MSRPSEFERILQVQIRNHESSGRTHGSPPESPGCLEPLHLSALFSQNIKKWFYNPTPKYAKTSASSAHNKPQPERAASSLKREKGPEVSNPKKNATGPSRGTTKAQKEVPAPPAKRKPPHKLTDLQQQSFLFFRQAGAPLPSDYNPQELKEAYRKLALLLHPDRSGGSQSDFQALLPHYKALNLVFK